MTDEIDTTDSAEEQVDPVWMAAEIAAHRAALEAGVILSTEDAEWEEIDRGDPFKLVESVRTASRKKAERLKSAGNPQARLAPPQGAPAGNSEARLTARLNQIQAEDPFKLNAALTAERKEILAKLRKI